MKEVIEDYSSEWPSRFNRIREIFEGKISAYSRIEHVGSSSIPGMRAKPVIDIDIVITSMEEFPGIRDELEHLGYTHHGNQGIEGREVFKRTGDQDSELDRIFHHLYVCPSNSEELRRHLIFRNALRKDKYLRDEYNRIKTEIISRVGKYNREGYVAMKEREYGDFFAQILSMKEPTIET